MKISIVVGFLAGGILASGALVTSLFYGSVLQALPGWLRGYTLFFPLPFYAVGGLLAGAVTRRGLLATLGFGMGSLLPGYLVPVCTVASQGVSQAWGSFLLTVGIPAASYAIAGAIGGGCLRCGAKAALQVAGGFVLGLGLGMLGAAILPRGIPVSLVIGTFGIMPWIAGGIATAWVLRSECPDTLST